MSDDPDDGSGHWTEAWRRDCERVGLTDTTTDLGEIKRAYAKTLRKTRPDDDAPAYQALREAYDRLVAHARRQALIAAQAGEEAATGADEPIPDRPVVVEPVVAASPLAERIEALIDSEWPATAPAQAPPPAPAPAPRAHPERPAFLDPSAGPSPEALCHELVDLLKLGPAKLEAALPAFRRQLGELPLDRQLEASARFADLVVQLEAHLPTHLIDLLREHFDWSRDFRIERMLGGERMAALAAVLDRHPPPITDPATLEEFGPTVRIAHLSGSASEGNRLKAFIGALLMGHTLPLHLQWAGWQLLRRLGLDEAELGAVQKLGVKTRNAALPLIALLAGVLSGMLAGSAEEGLGHAFSALSSVAIFCVIMGYVGQALDFLREAVPDWLAGTLKSERWERASPWVGAASFAVAGLVLHLAPVYGDAMAVLSLAFLAIGLLLGLKGTPAMITTAVALWGLVAWVVPTMMPLVAGLQAAWISAGVAVYRLRLYVPNPTFRVQPTRPAGGWQAIALLLTVGLPTLMAWLSSLCGMRLTLGAVTLALTAGSAVGSIGLLPRAALMVGTFYLTLGLWLAAQRAGWQLARRLFRGAPAASAADGGR
ncbi:hypothetical protein ACQ86G_08380 [Roseateles chitinivorans]|uniref:hypothetical protein n=1 Tax=Roseateles chitinivorans TaxID=2917965 RepID=UPI003D666A5F